MNLRNYANNRFYFEMLPDTSVAKTKVICTACNVELNFHPSTKSEVTSSMQNASCLMLAKMLALRRDQAVHVKHVKGLTANQCSHLLPSTAGPEKRALG